MQVERVETVNIVLMVPGCRMRGFAGEALSRALWHVQKHPEHLTVAFAPRAVRIRAELPSID
jgi:hypothetical protein